MTRLIESYDAIVFDWDGTVVDSVPYKIAQNKAIASEFDNELTDDEVRDIWNRSTGGFVGLMQGLCNTTDMDAIMEVVKRDYHKPEYAKRPFAFGAKVLDQLRAEGKIIGLVTGATRDILQADAADLGFLPLDRYFDYTMGADECEYKKPDPRVFGPLLQAVGAMPERIMYVGDELKDAEAALGAGMGFIGVESGMTTADEFRARALRSVKTIDELMEAKG